MSDQSPLGEDQLQRDLAESAPLPAAPPKRRSPWVTITGLGVLALSKLKFLLVGLKALPFSKILLTSGSMLVSMALYALSMGAPFAIGLVLMILVHELGHGLAMRRHGLALNSMLFIPFFGAMVSSRGQVRTPLVSAEIAIAGPLAGAVAALVCCLLFFVTHSPLFLALAHSGFFLNLLNLTPFGMFDGGAVARVFSRNLWIVGALLLAAMFALTHSLPLLMIALLSLPTVLGRSAPPVGDEEVTRSERVNMAFHYFGLCGFLAAGMYLSQRLLHPI